MSKKQGIPTGTAMAMIGLILVIVIGASAGVLTLVNAKMSAYEKTMPNAALEAYMKKIEKQDYSELYEQFQTRTGSLSSEADFNATMNTIYGNVDFQDLSYVKDDKTAEGHEGTYGVYSDGKKVSTLNLRKENDAWQVETIMQSSGNLSYLIDAPAAAQVKVNGILLGSDYVKETQVPAGTFDRYKTSSAAPSVTRYEISELMSEPEISADGYKVVKDAYEERFYVGSEAAGEVKNAGEKTMIAIAEAAARYATGDGSLGTLTGYFLTGSEFATKIRTMDNQWYTSHAGVKFENSEVIDLIQIDDDDLVGKVIFDYTVLSNTYGNRTYHCGYQIVLTRSSGNWKAVDLVVNNDLNPANN
ncbi:NTF2-like N-terminal transpeptidase domain-containing protein [Holdemania massiliensis]|uniref:NTF2-like N-terminal transpeptidase domain-containing protein n=1 Tax=Holdemania massiliensis TaxID=1468449 RepID=UPI001F063D25|nr:NTF2-like N-terminal transpeptidase domain-containing protein [Holdemania massiliensis]MCH1940335.1 hypothetical protein [Holdemania massiliensis]